MTTRILPDQIRATQTDVLLGRNTAGAGAVEEIACTSFARSILDDTTAAAVRATIGAGTGSGTVTSVDVSGGTTGLTTSGGPVTTSGTITIAGTLAVANGGTGSTTASAARTALGLAIGTDVQAYDAELAALAGLTSAADKLPYFTGSGTAALADFTAAGRALVDDASASAQRTTLGLGTISTQDASSVAITGGTLAGLTGLAIRDTSAAYDVTLAATSSTALTAGRMLTLDVVDGARTVKVAGNLTVSSAATVSGTNTGDQTITLTGDVTGSGAGSFAATIAANAVSYSKMQNVSAASRLLGRGSAGGAGVPEEISLGSGMSLSGTTLSATGTGGTVTSVDVSGGTTGLTTSGGPITTSGTITLAGTLAVANGGTGSTTASAARTALGLAIGSDVQAYDAELAALAGLTSAADKLPYFTGSGTAALADFTAAGRALVDDADAATQRATLGLGTIATQAASSVTITGGTIAGLTGLAIRDTSAAYDVTIVATSSTTLTAGRTLTVDVVNAARTVKIAGNLTVSSAATISGTNTGDQTITLTGDVTGSGTGSFAASIASNAVTNTQIRDSAAVSVIGRSANSSGDPADIAAASNGTFLGRRADAVSFLSPKTSELTVVGCEVYNSTAQSCATATWTALTADTENLDTDSLHSTSTNTSRITIPTGMGGVWFFSAYVSHAFNATGSRGAAIRINGATYEFAQHHPAIGATYGNACNVAGAVKLAAGDYVEICSWQTSGGNLNATLVHFSATYLGA